MIYPQELEIKEATEQQTGVSYLDLCISIQNNGSFNTRHYDKRNDFDFPIVNFPFMSSNIPRAPAYGVYISQLLRYARSCTFYEHFCDRHRLLAVKLLNQGYTLQGLEKSFNKLYGRHADDITKYDTSRINMIRDALPYLDLYTEFHNLLTNFDLIFA